MVSPAPPKWGFLRKSLVLSRGVLSWLGDTTAALFTLGHGELLIAVLQQIGSSVQMTPGRSGRGTRLGIVGSGPLEMLMLFPFQCGYSGDLGTAQGSLPD